MHRPRQHTLLLATALAVPALLGGCYTPNLLGRTAAPVFAAQDFGDHAEAVEVRVDGDGTLRGVFVDAGEDAPVVLHLLGGGETLSARTKVAGEQVWVGDTMHELAELGMSSLVLDYRGVGNSSGTRDSCHAPADARAAWGEAVRRAGGDARRVILRAISFGTLAAASLLEDGIEPGAVVLIAPIRAETIAEHWLRARHSLLAAWLGSLILRQPLPTSQETAISRRRGPLLVVFGTRDELLPDGERARLRAAARAAGATIIERDQLHLPLARDAHRLLPEEAALYAALR